MNLKTLTQECTPAKILAVSKLQPESKIRSLYHEGQRLFGENYVQEALEKMDHLQDLPDIQWHLIGSLQKNKAKLVVGKFALIHSVDSLALAETLSRQCENKNVTQNILIQVNLAKEETKGGFDKESLLKSWQTLAELPHLNIMGLMTMPPLTETGVEVRLYFRELRQLLMELRSETNLKRHPLTELSMGTSHDFKVAVEEGATIVRLGTILFGERPAKM
ncbi:YggS family pyridoxal phosphate-dependent enzyme [Bdellovibrio sp. BCCA]|uniref:YggS family pyridoxal phosphate-dependent enzyme n=1 Tax=Bdellovibrio sp. BCCA TaxID=3136281 RepID=UPI0030F1836F